MPEPETCMLTECKHFNDDAGRTNLCGCHLYDLIKAVERARRKDPKALHRARFDRILNTLTAGQVESLLLN